MSISFIFPVHSCCESFPDPLRFFPVGRVRSCQGNRQAEAQICETLVRATPTRGKRLLFKYTPNCKFVGMAVENLLKARAS
jgi:hypothetical protein